MDDNHELFIMAHALHSSLNRKNSIFYFTHREVKVHMAYLSKMVGEAGSQPTLDPEYMDLLLSIVNSAIRDLSMHGATRNYAFYWLFQEHSDRIMSLEWICESLGMDAHGLRKRIQNGSQPSPQMRELPGMTCAI